MKLKFFATFRSFTRCKEEDVVAPTTVWDLLLSLSERYGASFSKKLLSPDGSEINEETIIMVNGLNILHLDGKNTPLTETDIVSIFPVVAGG